MILFLLAYLGGVLTIVSPCILPVLPFVFARADRPFLRSGLPMLLGMARDLRRRRHAWRRLAAAGRSRPTNMAASRRSRCWHCSASRCCFPRLSDRLTRPLVALGARLSQSAEQAPAKRAVVLPSLLLGVATGLLWAPCAGPVLGLILTGAALQGASVADLAAAARLCRGRGDFAGAGAPRRRAGLRRDEALARRRRMGAARPRRRGARRPSPRSRSGSIRAS